MGVWSSHMSVVASGVLEFGWGWSFLVPGVLVIVVGVIVFCFLVASPDDLGFEMVAGAKEIEMNVEGGSVVNLEKVESEEAGLLKEDSDSLAAIGFLEAWKLPGVAPFAFCHFFSKTAGILSTIFNIGVFGGVLAGFVSDIIDVTSVTFLLLSIPTLILYRIYGSVPMVTDIALMFLSGLLVNGPCALITTAVSAYLGTQDLIKGNSRALAAVSAIIDGTGSVGAALGPLLAGYISTRGWNSVFFMLIFSIFLASLFLIHIAKTEIGWMVNEWKRLRSGVTAS